MLAVAAVREGADDATVQLPAKLAGAWVDVLAAPERGRTLELDGEVALADISLPGWPVALLERARS